MWIKIIASLVLALLSALFYRFGGIGKPFRSWHRDWICPAFSIATLLIWWHNAEWWKLAICSVATYGLMGAAFSTYWDWLFNGKDNFYVHGAFIGLAIAPFIWVGLAWWLVFIQVVATGAAMGIWCRVFGNDWVEECGRGFFASIFRTIA